MRHAQQLRDALPVIGLWASIDSSVTAEAAALAGADYVVVDEQHGVVDPTGMAAMVQAIQVGGAAPLVRVARNDPWIIGHALDLGALGVIVPMVDDGAQAARALAACRYAPQGERSTGVVRGEREAEPLCLVMIETRTALDRLEEIAATPGLDGIYIGPSDLALTFGLQPTPSLEHPPVLEAIERIRSHCAERGLICGLHCIDPQDAARYSKQGFGLITAGGDLAQLRAALARAVATARAG